MRKRLVFGAATLVLSLGVSACVSSEKPPATPVSMQEAVPAATGIDALVAKHAARNGVPVELAQAVIRKESGGNPRATGRGTIGLMQIKLATARGIGYRGGAKALYHPDTNLTWGMRYLGRAYELAGGDICGTVMRYQGGHRATRMTAANSRYCADVKRMMAES